jgi:starvation-inducible DNA-binding protein
LASERLATLRVGFDLARKAILSKGDPMTAKIRKLDPRKPAAPLDTPTDLSKEAVRDISAALNGILADAFALYLKTKNFHWHVSGPHFRDYHLLLEEQAAQIFAATDDMAERVRKIGGVTLRSIGDISRHQSIKDNDEDFVAPVDMLRELLSDNKSVAEAMREAHELCDKHGDAATASMLEVWIDETEKRTWFLFEASRQPDDSGH